MPLALTIVLLTGPSSTLRGPFLYLLTSEMPSIILISKLSKLRPNEWTILTCLRSLFHQLGEKVSSNRDVRYLYNLKQLPLKKTIDNTLGFYYYAF